MDSVVIARIQQFSANSRFKKVDSAGTCSECLPAPVTLDAVAPEALLFHGGFFYQNTMWDAGGDWSDGEVPVASGAHRPGAPLPQHRC